MLNVLAAAQQHHVRRVVFASSRFALQRWRTDYNDGAGTYQSVCASKLFARVGKMFSERHGVSFIAFRMGVCQCANGNLHGAWIPFSRWGQAMWVSGRDLCRALTRDRR
jgi:NAD+ dependent glucose-6-phosphate dehydrogenase